MILNDNIFKKLFFGLMIFLMILMPILSFDYGISGDEYVQNLYGYNALKFYQSFGEDDTIFTYTKTMYYYGALFDLTATFLNTYIKPFSEYDTRHLLNALFGLLAILFTGLTAKQLGGWRAGILALVFIALSPRFFGHSMNNPKDIPFAAAYIMAIYFMIIFIKQIDKPKLKTALLLAAAIAMAINIRVGGILLIAYLLLFYGMTILLKVGKDVFKVNKLQPYAKNIKYLALIIILGYFGGVLFWPYGLIDPITHPLTALQMMSAYPINLRILFEGAHISSLQIPWYYVPKWILITTPLFILIGTLLFVLTARLMKEYYDLKDLLIIFFTCVFPIFYVIYKDANLYDGWRHLLFVYPSLVVLAALAWDNLYNRFTNKYAKYAITTIMAILLYIPLSWSVKNHPHQYVYFNKLIGGIDKAYGKYETDYYMNSIKPAAKWLIKNEDLENIDKPITIVTNCFFPALDYFKHLADKVTVKYIRYYEREKKDWDYAIFYSRFINNKQLKNRSWPPKGTIHTIKADKTPLSIVVKRVSKLGYLGNQALKQNNFPEAIRLLTEAVRKDSKNESLYIDLAQVYLNIGALDKAVDCLQKSLKIYPDNVQGYSYLGMIYLKQQAFDRAILSYGKLLKLSPYNPIAYTNMGLAYARKGDYNIAIQNLKIATRINPKGIEAYQYLGSVYQQMGDAQTAQRYFNIVEQLRKGK